jgi:hypothetical protein
MLPGPWTLAYGGDAVIVGLRPRGGRWLPPNAIRGRPPPQRRGHCFASTSSARKSVSCVKRGGGAQYSSGEKASTARRLMS